MWTLTALKLFIYFMVFCLGLSLGSFLNSWIWRTRENIRIVSGRSICPHCRRQLRWYENIPVFSYVFLRGRCLTCQKPIPWYYTAVEFSTAVLLTFVFWFNLRQLGFDTGHYLRDVFFLTLLIVIFTFDSLYKTVLLRVVVAGMAIGFAFNYFYLQFTLPSLFYGVLFGWGFFFLQYFFSRGRWIGGGDLWLGAMMGIWLGWPNILVAIGAAYILGALVAAGLLISRKKQWQSEVPFGTFLAVGTFFTIYWGDQIISWYMNFLQ